MNSARVDYEPQSKWKYLHSVVNYELLWKLCADLWRTFS